MSDGSITLSPASDEDMEFSYQVKKAAEGDLIRKTFGWDEVFQRDFHKKDWTQNRPDIIRLDGVPIGTVAIVQGPEYVEVGQFFILPEYQNRGIGSCLLHAVLGAADERGQVVKLAYLRGNRAEALYRRNGFEVVSQTQTHCHAERRPRAIIP
jgi:GNAT superfamily N-acetyltransferase